MKKLIALGALALPFVAAAQAVRDADSLFAKFSNLLNAATVIIISISVVWLIYGVFLYMIAGDDDKKKAGKWIILQGVIALFVMLSIWGLVNILNRTFKLENRLDESTIPTAPTIPRVN